MNQHAFTFHDLVTRNAMLHGAGRAFTFGEQCSTHAGYAEQSARLAAGLANGVAILAHNGMALCLLPPDRSLTQPLLPSYGSANVRSGIAASVGVWLSR